MEDGPSHNLEINLTHDIRKNIKSANKIILEVGKFVNEIIRHIPNGVVLVFASHSLL